jgi:hypothetical protein
MIQISVVQHDGVVLPSQLQNAGFQIGRCTDSDKSAHCCRACEVALAHSRVEDQGLEHHGGILRPVNQEVDHAWREARILEKSSDEIMSAWAEFGTLSIQSVSLKATRVVQHGLMLTLRIAVFPAATAAATARNPRIRGSFHGAIPSMTPRGSLTTTAWAYGSATIGQVPDKTPDVVRAATLRSNAIESWTFMAAHFREQPSSSTMISCISKSFSSSS